MPLRLVSERPRTTLVLILLFILALTLPAMAGVNGAIYTTTSTGTTVNGNVYDTKADVYLSGGPQNTHDAGLSPDGLYYFQVTDPSGATLLSTDDISCRMVTVTNGRITGAAPAGPNCSTGAHANGTFNGSNGETPVQLMPFNDTPNSGGEYKAWMTPVAAYDNCSGNHSNKTFGFCDSDSKTDNFKIKSASAATVTVCKFNDWDGNGSQDSGEPFIEHWPISATGVDNGPVNTQTDDHGCASFSVSHFDGNGTATVTLTEGNEGPDWSQTAPAAGPCGDGCNVDNGAITLTVKAGDNIAAPNFGNHDPNCSTGCYGNTLVVTKTANPSLKRTYTWGITKSVDTDHANTSGSATFNYTVDVTHDAGTDSDWKVTGAIRVANPTPDDVTNLNVTDAIGNGGDCVVSGGPNGDGTGITVESGNHVDLLYTCTFTAAPPAGTNTATAAWPDGAQDGTANYDFANAAVALVDDKATITDSLGGTLGTVSASDASPSTFPYSQTFTDPAGTCTTHENIATFTTNTTSATGSDRKSVTVCVGANLSVSKTAVAAFTSGITKKADKTLVEQADGNATFNYTVTVTESGWNVSGDITVTNPNDWQAVTVNVADVFSDAGGSCSLASATLTVPASGFATDHYTCTFAAAPAASGTNTGNISWDSAAAFTTGDAASSGAVSYAFSALTVNDSYKGLLGTISAPADTTTYNYSRTVQNATGGRCSTFDNTATIRETGASASQSVTICNTNTGALTIGFWQNKNGQGIITASASASNVCKVGTWLRQLAPYQDLSATASCSQVATYAYNLIKAANASGASMNAMLKAQMLATAMDVYFSDPALGGNKIGAPNPVGSDKIDLTKVCNMIDSSSSGTGSCSGSTSNASSAFLNNNSLTVSQMLAAAASYSNAGGSVWYGQVKAVQQLAKNAFDAINNRAAQIAP